MRALFALPLLITLAACERQEESTLGHVEASAGEDTRQADTDTAVIRFERARLDRWPAAGFELPVAHHRLHENPAEVTGDGEYRALLETFDDRASILAALNEAFSSQGFSAGEPSTADGSQILTYRNSSGDVVTIRLSSFPEGASPTAPGATGLLHLTWDKPS